jgi:glycerate kinase
MPPVASTGIPTGALVAPDSFKGTFSAREVAAALARGLERAGVPSDLCPAADGGEGTLAALTPAFGLELVTAPASDPLGRPLDAGFGLSADQSVAVVEVAAASGLPLVAPAERDAIEATSFGTGELIAAALSAGARTVYIGVGGSATTDGGSGAIDALEAAGGLDGAKLALICDVRTPFEDAARVFAPQKGADPVTVMLLSERLDDQAEEYERKYGRDPRGVPMTGGAGGLAGGLWAAFGAELVAGAPFVLNALDYDTRMRAVKAVITGEGRIDRQSLVGKLISEAATRARQAGVPCHAVVGKNELDPFDARILDLQLILEATTLEEIEAAGTRIGEELTRYQASVGERTGEQHRDS